MTTAPDPTGCQIRICTFLPPRFSTNSRYSPKKPKKSVKSATWLRNSPIVCTFEKELMSLEQQQPINEHPYTAYADNIDDVIRLTI
jgi:hypothetical protein